MTSSDFVIYINIYWLKLKPMSLVIYSFISAKQDVAEQQEMQEISENNELSTFKMKKRELAKSENGTMYLLS